MRLQSNCTILLFNIFSVSGSLNKSKEVMGENSDVEPTMLSNLTQSRMGNKNTKEHKGAVKMKDQNIKNKYSRVPLRNHEKHSMKTMDKTVAYCFRIISWIQKSGILFTCPTGILFTCPTVVFFESIFLSLYTKIVKKIPAV